MSGRLAFLQTAELTQVLEDVRARRTLTPLHAKVVKHHKREVGNVWKVLQVKVKSSYRKTASPSCCHLFCLRRACRLFSKY